MKKIILIIIIFFLFIFLVLLPRPSQESIEFEVERGQRAREIASELEEKGIIKNQWFFNVILFLKRDQKNLRAGTYYLSPSMFSWEIINKLTKGSIRKVTIAEGLNIKEIANLLNRSDFVEKAYQDFSQEFSFLKELPEGLSVEGYLFPDTYDIVPGMTSKDIIRMMLKNFERKTEDLKTSESFFEKVIMASLIEKEVRTFEDKKIVSGILWKRKKYGMPLQVDATIAYITGKRTTRISIEETRIESPYNTYLNTGLPIGPITNPGLESIKASQNPQESPYWYYLSKPDGETVFSRNHQEHVQAKRKYLTD